MISRRMAEERETGCGTFLNPRICQSGCERDFPLDFEDALRPSYLHFFCRDFCGRFVHLRTSCADLAPSLFEASVVSTDQHCPHILFLAFIAIFIPQVG